MGPEQILNSFWTNNFETLYELCSSGQSGQLFYYTNDRKFMMKTIAKREFKQLKRILPQYYNFRIRNPYSMICQFYGMHKVIWGPENAKSQNIRYLVVMENLFKNFDVGTRFDLKGSSAGRETLKNEKTMEDERDITVSLKDNDFRKYVQKLKIVEQLIPKGANRTLLEIIDLDADFLASVNIIDYSLLLGEINLSEGKSGIKELREVCKSLPDFGTAIYLDSNGKAYVVGVIDPLTGFTCAKNIEYKVKRLKHGFNASCVPPDIYAQRFKSFIRDRVFEEGFKLKLKGRLMKKLHTIAEEEFKQSTFED